MSPADHARRIHARDPSLGPSEIARRVAQRVGHAVTRQQVAAALASDPTRRGRPPAPHVTLRVRVPRERVPGTLVIEVAADGSAQLVS